MENTVSVSNGVEPLQCYSDKILAPSCKCLKYSQIFGLQSKGLVLIESELWQGDNPHLGAAALAPSMAS